MHDAFFGTRQGQNFRGPDLSPRYTIPYTRGHRLSQNRRSLVALIRVGIGFAAFFMQNPDHIGMRCLIGTSNTETDDIFTRRG